MPLSQIKKRRDGAYYPAKHTELRLQAAVKVLEKNPDFRILLQGGYNFAVRYNEQQILKEANFSFSAFSKAREKESEANCGKTFLINHGIDASQIMTEEVSATSAENVQIAAIMLSRDTFAEIKEIGILSLAYHLERILPLYKKELGGKFKVIGILAEQFLPLKDSLSYYSTPKGGKMWDVRKILEKAGMFPEK